jgi:alkylation response protein AidB-like acyl-CoA dehydrogenase
MQAMTILQQTRDELIAGLREFAARSVAPRVAQYDEAEKLPRDLLDEMAELDLFGGTVPVEWSGTELDHVTFSMLIEEISRVDHVLGVLMSMPSALVGSGLLVHGTDEQKKRYLAPLAAGKIFGGAGVTEPQSGSDVAGTRTRFRRDGNGFVLTGGKTWTSNLDIASFFIVFAVEEDKRGRSAMSAFIVDADTPGVVRNPFRNKLGFRPICTGELFFDEVRLPAEALLGESGAGFAVAMVSVERGRLAVASRAVGIAQACLEDSVAWACDRRTFGRPIASYQQVASKLADMAMEVEAARLLARRCAEAMDAGSDDVRMLASMSKCFAADVAQRTATEAVQIFGSNGVAGEMRVGRLYRDAKVFQIVEGTNEIQRNIIARTLTGIGPR